MFYREITSQLQNWKVSSTRKPLILRGARQVGKTTIVNEFGKSYENYLYLNLEDVSKVRLLEREVPLDVIVESLFYDAGAPQRQGDTLIFIDEIQNSSKTIAKLRYFYEQRNDLHVIAAGSLLENIVDVNASFPVGRVQYMAVRPCSFKEFVSALGHTDLLHALEEPGLSTIYHERLMNLFNRYTVVGGMPEAVQRYATTRDLLSMDDVYETLLQTYRDDTEKYVKGNKLTNVVRHILSYGWSHACETITLGNFAGSKYQAREVGEAFTMLSKAMLIELVYPSTSAVMPFIPEMRRRPKLIWLDTGLVNYAAQLRDDVITALDIMDVWRGRISEHIVAQELLALSSKVSERRGFWVNGKGGDTAEVDFTYIHGSRLYPIEVKAGHNSHLKSLHSFIDKSAVDIAVRVWSQPFSVNELTTSIGRKPFRLINLPFYLVGQLPVVLNQVIAQSRH